MTPVGENASTRPAPFQPRRRRRVGVIDLLADAPPRGFDRVYAAHFRRQFTSIMPQAISVWARSLGHEVFYATYYGQALPHTLVPADVAAFRDARLASGAGTSHRH